MPELVDDVAGPGLQKLLAPRSIAIVGASTRPGTEVLSDRVFAEPPLDLARAKALLGRLQERRLLVGLRGCPHATWKLWRRP
jgi:hypothetical protein